MAATRSERSVFMAVRAARSLEAAVQVVGMACAADLVPLDELRAYAVRLRHAGRPSARPRSRGARTRARLLGRRAA